MDLSDKDIENYRKKVLSALSNNYKFSKCLPEDIEDALQYALLTYAESIDKNSRTERFTTTDAFNAWLFTVSHNKLIDILRKKQYLVQIYEDNDERDNDPIGDIFGQFIDSDNPLIEFIYDYQNEENIDRILINFWELIYKEGDWDEIEKIILQKHHQEGIDLRVLAEEIKMTPNSLYLKNKRLKEKIKDIMNKNNIHNITDLDY
jgi:RNA polymerase sigma factor (sigma-70 family)